MKIAGNHLGLDTQTQFQGSARPWIEPQRILKLWNYRGDEREDGKDNVVDRERVGWESHGLTTGNKNGWECRKQSLRKAWQALE